MAMVFIFWVVAAMRAKPELTPRGRRADGLRAVTRPSGERFLIECGCFGLPNGRLPNY
jgi:hypothetical protein